MDNQKTIYFGITESYGDLYIYFSYESDGTITYEFEPEDIDRLDDLQVYDIYEIMESVYQAPPDMTYDQIIELFTNKFTGFEHCYELEKIEDEEEDI